MTSAQIQSLTTSQLQSLTDNQFNYLFINDLPFLSSLQPATTSQLQSLSSTQLQSLTPSQIQSLTDIQFNYLFINDLPFLSSLQPATTSQLQSLTTTQLQSLTNTQLQSLTQLQLNILYPPPQRPNNVQIEYIKNSTTLPGRGAPGGGEGIPAYEFILTISFTPADSISNFFKANINTSVNNININNTITSDSSPIIFNSIKGATAFVFTISLSASNKNNNIEGYSLPYNITITPT